MFKLIPLWFVLGLLGTAIMLFKNRAIFGRTLASSILTLPIALVFGPIWFLMALTTRSQKECPFCKSIIPAAATVCSECTRSIEQ